MAQFRSASGLQKVEGGSVVSQDPLLWYPRWWLVRSEMVWQEGVVLLTLGPASLPVSPSPPPFSILLPQLLFPSQGPMDGLGTVRWAPCSVVVEWKTTQCALSRLVEFQTLMIFDCNCNLNGSKAYKYSKIVKITTNTFCMNENVFIILLQQITII